LLGIGEVSSNVLNKNDASTLEKIVIAYTKGSKEWCLEVKTGRIFIRDGIYDEFKIYDNTFHLLLSMTS